jgi:hypothetical protein
LDTRFYHQAAAKHNFKPSPNLIMFNSDLLAHPAENKFQQIFTAHAPQSMWLSRISTLEPYWFPFLFFLWNLCIGLTARISAPFEYEQMFMPATEAMN